MEWIIERALRWSILAMLGARMLSAAPSWSSGLTMRLTLTHMGTTKEEHIAVQKLRLEGPWAGPRGRFIDTSNLGDYLLELEHPSTNEALYSRGFDAEFDATEIWSSAVYSLRFPAPSKAVLIVIKVRNTDNVGFHELWHYLLSPDDESIDKTPLASGDVAVLQDSGPTEDKVDLEIIGDGYRAAEREKFIRDARRATEYLFSTSPYKNVRNAFNIRAVFVASGTSGIMDAPSGIYVHSALGMSYGFNGIERAIGTLDDSALRESAATAPYEFLLVIANSERYGGGADLQRLSTVSIDSIFARYLVLHEFSHQFAGLADEYYSLAACDSKPHAEPWRPNITAKNTLDGLKWGSLVAAGMPLPSPWRKKPYEDFDSSFIKTYFAMRKAKAQEAAVNPYIRKSVNEEIGMLSAEPLYGQVGLFEGADYQACGLYRPEPNCIMFTINPDYFCKVCTRAILAAIGTYSYV